MLTLTGEVPLRPEVVGPVTAAGSAPELVAHGLAELLPERGLNWWRPTDDARARWTGFFAAPPVVEGDDEAAAATEVAESEAALQGAGMVYDSIEDDF